MTEPKTKTRRQELAKGITLGLPLLHIAPIAVPLIRTAKNKPSRRQLIYAGLTAAAITATYAVLARNGINAYQIPLWTNGLSAAIYLIARRMGSAQSLDTH